MAFDLNEINYRTVADPAAFVAECDAEYNAKVARAADMISANRKRSPIVLLSGPQRLRQDDDGAEDRGGAPPPRDKELYDKPRQLLPHRRPGHRSAHGGGSYDFESPGASTWSF